MNKRYHIIISIVIVCTLYLTIGFSSFVSEISVSNIVANIRIEKDVRITNVSIADSYFSNGEAPTYINYDDNSIITSNLFTSIDDYLVLDVTITNIGSADVGIYFVSPTSGISTDFFGYTMREKICDDSGKCNLGISKTIQVNVWPGSSSGLNLDSVKLDFDFREFHKITYEGITNNNYPTEIIAGGTLNLTFQNPPDFINVYNNGIELDRKTYSYNDGKLIIENVNGSLLIEKGESTLIDGHVFSKQLKDFVNGTTDSTYKSEDYTIKHIGFYEDKMPDGFTKEKMEELPYISVSSDNNVKAYNDNGNIYVYSKHDIRAGTSMYSMFREMKNLSSIDLAVIETENVKDMRSIFNGSSSLRELDVSHFDTSSADQMGSMFKNLSLITKLDLTNWNTSKAIRFDEMFSGCTNLKELDLTSFDTSNLTMTYRMFYGMTNIENIYVGNKWNMSTLTTLGYKGDEFYNCTKLPNFDSTVVDHTKAFVGEGGYLSYLPE